MTREIPYEVVDAAYVEREISKMPIVDVRPKSMYDEGHVPSAINIPYGDAEKESVERKEFVGKVLEGKFQAMGISQHDACIVYCQMGYHATLTCEALAQCDYDQLRLYEGSFEDWSSDKSRPVVTSDDTPQVGSTQGTDKR